MAIPSVQKLSSFDEFYHLFPNCYDAITKKRAGPRAYAFHFEPAQFYLSAFMANRVGEYFEAGDRRR
jgi:hypothetical protein